MLTSNCVCVYMHFLQSPWFPLHSNNSVGFSFSCLVASYRFILFYYCYFFFGDLPAIISIDDYIILNQRIDRQWNKGRKCILSYILYCYVFILYEYVYFEWFALACNVTIFFFFLFVCAGVSDHLCKDFWQFQFTGIFDRCVNNFNKLNVSIY